MSDSNSNERRTPPHRLHVEPAIFERFPGYAALVLYASGLTNVPGNAESAAALRQAEAAARAAFGEEKPSAHPHIAAWRAAYAAFGARPNKFLCSAEALLKRVLKGDELPSINYLVDVYNAVSVRHVVPAGGEDWDQLRGDLRLGFSAGDEPFPAVEHGEEVVDYPEKGEVVWMDAAGVTCRRWNWRQTIRTAITLQTTNAYFVLDSLPPYTLEQLDAARAELVGHLRRLSPECEISEVLFSAETGPAGGAR